MSKKKKGYLILGIVVLLGIILDLITKILFAKYFEGGGKDIVLIPNFFSFTFVKNTGAAFGIFGDSTVALTIVSLVFVGLFITYDILYHSDNMWYVLGLSMLISGAIGNFIDRVFLGYVRDFINIEIFPFVFNVADALITFGVICFAVYLIFYGFKSDKSNETIETAKVEAQVTFGKKADEESIAKEKKAEAKETDTKLQSEMVEEALSDDVSKGDE